MNCKACNKELTDGEGRQVAQWIFCDACFQKLLEHPSGDGSMEPEASGSASGEVGVTEDEASCHLCRSVLAPGEGWRLGPWLFCDECRRSLTTRPSEPLGEAELPAPAPDQGAFSSEQEEPVPIVIQTRLGLGRTTLCARCRKRILERAGKMLEGELLCPDCYYAAPVSPPDSHGPSSSDEVRGDPRQLEADEAATTGECDSCGKSVSLGRLEVRGGFSLCRACLSTDPDLALEIARGRHRKRLEELKARFS